MTEIPKDTFICNDSITCVASFNGEILRDSLKGVKDQAGMNKLIERLINKSHDFRKYEQDLDLLGEFIKSKTENQENTKVQIHAIKPNNIEGIPLGKLSTQQNQKPKDIPKVKTINNQESRKNTPSLDMAMEITFSKETYKRFLVAYNNYMSLDEDVRLSIYNLSKQLKIRHADALGLMATESGFNTLAKSPAGAEGLAQVMPEIRRGLKRFIESGSQKVSGQEGFFARLRGNPTYMSIYTRGGTYENISLGLALYSYHHNVEKYSRTDALRIYNGGYKMPNVPENIQYPKKVIANSQLFERTTNIRLVAQK